MQSIILNIINLFPQNIKEFFLKRIGSDIGGRMSRGFFWALSGSVISRTLMLLSSIIIARLLGKIQFGEMSIIQSTIGMFIALANFGLGITATKYIAEYRIKDPAIAGNILATSRLVAFLFGTFFVCVFIFYAPSIAINIMKAPYLINELRVGSIMLFFNALNGYQSGALAGFEDFKTIAKINLRVGLTYLPILITTTIIFGLFGSILGLSISACIEWFINNYFLRKKVKEYSITIVADYKIKSFQYIWNFSLPAVLGGLLVGTVIWFINILLINTQNGYSEMAILSVGRQWQSFILFIPLALAQIILPILSNLKNDRDNFIKVFKYNVVITALITLLVAGVVSLFSGFILKAYGSDFLEGKIVIIVLSFSAVFFAINNVAGYVLASLGKMWVGFSANLVWAVCFIYFSHLMIGIGFGSLGLALAMLISYLIHSIAIFSMTNWYLKKYL